MIVVDANVLAASLIWGTPASKALLAMDADWVVPPIWLAELRNVLVKYIRQDRMSADEAMSVLEKAWKRVTPADREIPSRRIMELAATTRSSAYDCEYVVLAEMLHLKLITGDRALAGKFPGVAVPLESFQ